MGLMIVVYILILVAVLAICFYLASKAGEIADDKGYDGDKWKWICFWLGLVGYILVAAMPNLTMQATLKNIEAKLMKDGNDSHSSNNSSNSTMKSLSEMTPLAPLASDSPQEKKWREVDGFAKYAIHGMQIMTISATDVAHQKKKCDT